MGSDPLGEYQEAMRAVEAAEDRADRLVLKVSEGARKLERWKRVAVSNVEAGFPAGYDSMIDGRVWPDGEQLAEALSGYHSALAKAWVLYSSIPENQRGVVKPPPERSGR